MKKQEKGITLVALVITIIVLVILVGVSITAAINSGIIGQAKEVTEQYEAEEVLELRANQEAERWIKQGLKTQNHFHSYVQYSDTKLKCFCGDEKEITDKSYFGITPVNLLYPNKDFGSITTIVVPAKLDGKEVKSIAGIGTNRPSLESVIIPEGIETITSNTFVASYKLTSVVISEGVTTIEARSFGGTSIKELVLPSTITEIGSKAFSMIRTGPDATALEKIEVNMTKAEWEKVNKASDWVENAKTTVVSCIDGEVSI